VFFKNEFLSGKYAANDSDLTNKPADHSDRIARIAEKLSQINMTSNYGSSTRPPKTENIGKPKGNVEYRVKEF